MFSCNAKKPKGCPNQRFKSVWKRAISEFKINIILQAEVPTSAASSPLELIKEFLDSYKASSSTENNVSNKLSRNITVILNTGHVAPGQDLLA
ncbi:hypothetical protein ACJMK2_038002 [Sinanodonta woodiana]|uniref:Uncharacterized protein n=1 Tax=Sinanodonta woodiana TaxID=1069815 RepID=A0ABD3WM66_SINWO